MFRISKKADYAVFIMCQLARDEKALLEASTQQGERPRAAETPPTSAQELAQEAGLSKPVTANLMKALTRFGLLDSVRGTNGGYRLARRADDITLHQILEAVEGPMFLVACASDPDAQGNPKPKPNHDDCSLTHCCPSRSAMRLVHDRIQRLFSDITLAELSAVDNDPLAALAVGGTIPDQR